MMNKQFLCIYIVLLGILPFCYCQKVNYRCNFDQDFTHDCQFQAASDSSSLTISTGSILNGYPIQPLSDVTAVKSLTMPNNEPCILPYKHPRENWPMYFCQRIDANNYVCPTASGLGRCSIGKFASVSASGTGSYSQSYSTHVRKSESRIQCLDFYYYMPEVSNNAKIQIGWKTATNAQLIIEVASASENRWQHSRSSFSAPEASSYELTFRMIHGKSNVDYVFALDEINIYDQSCETKLTESLSDKLINVQLKNINVRQFSDTTDYELVTDSSTLFDINTDVSNTKYESATDDTVLSHASTVVPSIAVTTVSDTHTFETITSDYVSVNEFTDAHSQMTIAAETTNHNNGLTDTITVTAAEITAFTSPLRDRTTGELHITTAAVSTAEISEATTDDSSFTFHISTTAPIIMATTVSKESTSEVTVNDNSSVDMNTSDSLIVTTAAPQIGTSEVNTNSDISVDVSTGVPLIITTAAPQISTSEVNTNSDISVDMSTGVPLVITTAAPQIDTSKITTNGDTSIDISTGVPLIITTAAPQIATSKMTTNSDTSIDMSTGVPLIITTAAPQIDTSKITTNSDTSIDINTGVPLIITTAAPQIDTSKITTNSDTSIDMSTGVPLVITTEVSQPVTFGVTSTENIAIDTTPNPPVIITTHPSQTTIADTSTSNNALSTMPPAANTSPLTTNINDATTDIGTVVQNISATTDFETIQPDVTTNIDILTTKTTATSAGITTEALESTMGASFLSLATTTESTETNTSVDSTTGIIFPQTSFQSLQPDNASADTTTASIPPAQTTVVSSTIAQTIQESSTTNTPIETSPSSTSTTTTVEPSSVLLNCDFSINSCFGNSQLNITNGAEFSPVDLSEPPRFPLSDVSSINELTDNNETCILPYESSLINNANVTAWDMWFCYKQECPTASRNFSTCASGRYGLISIGAWESVKTIEELINPNMTEYNLANGQCLTYYYYMTVYDNFDWGQHISVLIKSDNDTNDEIEIDRVTIADMAENRWYFRNITFIPKWNNYILTYRFEVTDLNRTEYSAWNQTVYFALDNIDLYTGLCQKNTEFSTSTTSESTTTTNSKITTSTTPRSSVINETTRLTTTPVRTTLTPRVSTVTKTEKNQNETRYPEPEKSSNTGLILGLVFGLGLPILVISIFATYYIKVVKPNRKVGFSKRTENDEMQLISKKDPKEEL